MRPIAIACVVAASQLLAGCNLSQFAVDQAAPVLLTASRAFHRESDVRLAREAAPAQLKLIEGLLETAPRNAALLETAAQGYIEYAFGFLEDELESLPDDDQHAAERQALTRRATEIYDRARAFALRRVASRDRRLRRLLDRELAGVEDAVAHLDRGSVPGLFYAGFALVAAINLNRTDLGRVVELPKAVALLKRVRELDPQFYQGGASMILGVIYASQGRATGGDPAAASRYFAESLRVSGDRYLMTRVLMARYYAVSVQDRSLFQSTLEQVLAAPVDDLPDQRLANEIARLRAARYLAHAGGYFI